MYGLRQDLAYAMRQIGRNPWPAMVAVASLAAGIGATTTAFTLLNAVLWKELPVRTPGDLVVFQMVDSATGRIQGIPAPLLKGLGDGSSLVFTGVTAGINDGISFRAGEVAERVMGEAVAANFFEVLGVQRFVGRYFANDADGPAWRAEAVLSHDFYRRRFGGDPSILGQTVHLNGYPFTVIGVSPPGFFGVEVGSSWDVRVPMMSVPGMQARTVSTMKLLDPLNEGFVSPLARLRPGVTREQAEAAMDVLLQQLIASHQEIRKHEYGEGHVRLLDGSRGVSRFGPQLVRTLGVVMALASLLLLIACINVANLLFVWATERQREMAIRVAIGASRGRIVRQLLTEGLLVAAFGGAMGLLLAYWGAGLLVGLLPQGSIPIVLDVAPDARVAAFVCAVSTLAAVLSAFAPAARASQPDLVRPMAGDGAGSSRWFMIAQVALSVVVSMGAILFLRTLGSLQADLGYVPHRLLMFSMKPVRDGNILYTDTRLRQLFTELMHRVEELPGVAATSMAAGSLGTFNRQPNVVRIAREDQTTVVTSMRTDEVSAGRGFLATMGLAMAGGRVFNERDHLGPPVAILTEALARDVFGNAIALGRKIRIGDGGNPAEIVGIVSSRSGAPRDGSMQRFLFVPLGQGGLPSICTLLVRAESLPAGEVIAAVRNEIGKLDRNLPVFNIRSATRELDHVLARERLIAALSSLFGTASLFLVAIGLYGLISHSVVRRRKEIGIRMALGAEGGMVLRQILWEGLRLTAAGIMAGVPAAYVAGRFVSAELYGITPYDPAALAACTAGILAITIVASLLPARRAAIVDPMVALRQD